MRRYSSLKPVKAVRRRRYYYELRFTVTFENDNDTVYFAYSLPHSYFDLMKDVISFERRLLTLSPKPSGRAVPQGMAVKKSEVPQDTSVSLKRHIVQIKRCGI